MKETIVPTEAEHDAKVYLLSCMDKGFNCGIDEDSNFKFDKPDWYDDIKFKRAQAYYHNNRLGIMESNMCGLLTLIAEPVSIKILMATNKSSTAETARKRYVSTVLHTISWYENDLEPGSKSWESLKKVRQMHAHATKIAQSKDMGRISQTELALTTFGFLGVALIRPHSLGIRHDNHDDRVAFVHFWAVICYMIGVRDEFNMCLLPFDSVEIVCQLMLRYIFIPILQYENSDFKQMAQVLIDGLSDFIPLISYDYQMFKVKSTLGVPGYQYYRDLANEKPIRQVCYEDERQQIKTFLNSRFGMDIENINEKFCDDTVNQGHDEAGCPNCIRHKELLLNKNKLIHGIVMGDLDLKSVMCDFYLHRMTFKERVHFHILHFCQYVYEFDIGRCCFNRLLDIGQLIIKRYHSKGKPSFIDLGFLKQ